MRLKEDIKPLSYLDGHLGKAIDSVSRNRRPIVLTEEGSAKAVLMDVETYEQWREGLTMLKLLSQSEEDVRTGRLLSQEEAFGRANATLKRTAGDE
jgi:prevent-host-death family protein